MRKGILYRKSYAETIHAQVFQAVIPHSMRYDVMSDLHGDYMAGHPCPEKMLLKLKRYAIWPSINKDVTKFVENCKVFWIWIWDIFWDMRLCGLIVDESPSPR